MANILSFQFNNWTWKDHLTMIVNLLIFHARIKENKTDKKGTTSIRWYMPLRFYSPFAWIMILFVFLYSIWDGGLKGFGLSAYRAIKPAPADFYRYHGMVMEKGFRAWAIKKMLVYSV